MKAKLLLLAVLTLFVSSCSNAEQTSPELSDQKPQEVSETNWLDQSNDPIHSEGRNAFSSLLPSYDEFAKTGYYNLPKALEFKPKKNMINLEPVLVGNFEDGIDGSYEFSPQLSVMWFGDDWKFIRSIYFKFDSEVKEFESFGQKRDVLSAGMVLEFAPVLFKDKEDILFMSKIFETNNISIRVGGDKIIKDRALTQLEIDAIKRILLAYRYMYQNNLLLTIPQEN